MHRKRQHGSHRFLLSAAAFLHLLQYLIEVEAGRLLSLGIVFERRQELADDRLRRDKREGVIHDPIVVGVGGSIGALVRIGAKIEYLRETQSCERFGPDPQRSRRTLLHEDELKVVIA